MMVKLIIIIIDDEDLYINAFIIMILLILLIVFFSRPQQRRIWDCLTTMVKAALLALAFLYTKACMLNSWVGWRY